DSVSAWAKELRQVRIISLFIFEVSMFSFSKMTGMPQLLRIRTCLMQSRVLRAKREMDFVRMRSIFFCRHSSIILLVRQLRFLVHIHTANGALAAPGGDGVGDFPAHPAASGIEGGIGQIHTVAGICHFISLFCVFLDGDACAVQPSPAAKASSLRRKGTAYPFCGVDALPLCAGADLLKRRSCCFGERKYFSSAFFIKISDKVHPLAGLRNAEIFAVKHLPFHTIPQSIQRMEDGRKRPASVMVKQAGYVFKQQIRRSFCRSQPGNFKEQRTSWVGKPSTVSSNRKRLAGKSPAQQVEVGNFIG